MSDDLPVRRETLMARPSEVGGVDEIDAAVVLICGDSGVGKSELLAGGFPSESGSLATSVVKVDRSPGGLQRALVEALSEVAVEIASLEDGADRFTRIFERAVEKAGETALKDMRAAAGRLILGYVRTKLGEEAEALAKNLASSWSDASNEALEQRIRNSADSDVVSVLRGFMIEVVDACGTTLVMKLDDVQGLSDADLRQLEDLVRSVPESVKIVATCNVGGEEGRQCRQRLVAAGAADYQLGGMSMAEVSRWLGEEGVDTALAATVMSRTNGFPFYVADAIGLLQRSEVPRSSDLDSLGPSSVTRVQTEEALGGLTGAEREAVYILAAIGRLLDDREASAVLGVTPLRWSVFRAQLVDNGIFVDSDRPWFHELRRTAIWDSMSPEARNAAVAQARSALETELEADSSAALAATYAELTSGTDASSIDSEKVKAVAGLSTHALALAASVVELDDPGGDGAYVAELAVVQARTNYLPSGDFVAALDELVESGLVAVAGDEHVTIIAPAWGEIAAFSLVQGRAANELGRFPIPGLASQIARTVMLPEIGEFVVAAFGVGVLSAASMGKEISRLHFEQTGRMTGKRPPGIGVFARHGRTPMYMHASFKTVESRDSAIASMPTAARRVLGQSFEIVHLLAAPWKRIPEKRFALALDDLEFSSSDRSLEKSLRIEELLWATVRELSTDEERIAYNLLEPRGYAYYADEGQIFLAELRGTAGVHELGAYPDSSAMSASSRILISQELNFDDNTTIGSLSWSTSVHDPIEAVRTRLERTAQDFNKFGTELAFELHSPELRCMVTEAFKQRQSDSAALATALGVERRGPRQHYCVLRIVPEGEGLTRSVLLTASFPTDGDAELHFAIDEGASADGDSETIDELVLRHFDVELPEQSARGWSLSGVAELLGHDRVSLTRDGRYL